MKSSRWTPRSGGSMCLVTAQSDKDRREWERERKGKQKKQSKRAEDPLSVFFVAEESSPVALKRGIILSSKQTFGYSWLAERFRGLKEDTVRMGLNIKVNLRSIGLGHESTNAKTQRSQRGVLGVSGDQLPGAWTALWMTSGWGASKCHSGEWSGVVCAPAPNLRNTLSTSKNKKKQKNELLSTSSLFSCWGEWSWQRWTSDESMSTLFMKGGWAFQPILNLRSTVWGTICLWAQHEELVLTVWCGRFADLRWTGTQTEKQTLSPSISVELIITVVHQWEEILVVWVQTLVTRLKLEVWSLYQQKKKSLVSVANEIELLFVYS